MVASPIEKFSRIQEKRRAAFQYFHQTPYIKVGLHLVTFFTLSYCGASKTTSELIGSNVPASQAAFILPL